MMVAWKPDSSTLRVSIKRFLSKNNNRIIEDDYNNKIFCVYSLITAKPTRPRPAPSRNSEKRKM